MENKMQKIQELRNNLVSEQERLLSFRSACEGMKMTEDANASDHIFKARNRDISELNKLIRREEEKKIQKLTAPPKSLFYTDPKSGQSFVDEEYAKKDRRKAIWFGLGLGFTAGLILACSKKKGGEE